MIAISNSNIKVIVLVALLLIFVVLAKPLVKSTSTNNSNLLAAQEQMEIASKKGLGMWLLIGSGTCDSCKEMTVIFNQLKPEYEEQVSFIKVDVYDKSNEDILILHDIRFIPTNIFIDKNGKVAV